jgi:anti-anti-sigma factor
MATITSRPRTDAIELHIMSDASDLVRVRIEGRMSHRFEAKDEEPLHAAFGWDTYSRRVMLDLSEVSAIDTSALSWLMLINKRLDYFGGKLVLHSLSPVVRSLIRVLNLQAVLTIADDEADAEAILAGGKE